MASFKIATPSINAAVVAQTETVLSQKVGVAYSYGGIKRHVAQGMNDLMIGPGGVIMSRRSMLEIERH